MLLASDILYNVHSQIMRSPAAVIGKELPALYNGAATRNCSAIW